MTFAMSMSNLSIDGEFRYIIKWFNEWSELQRDDFIPVLVDCLNQDSQQGVVYMNGLVNAVAIAGISDRPMSLFQCRIKLFREWTPKWSSELKHKLKDAIIEIDAKVGEKIIDAIKSGQTEIQSNGPEVISDANDVDELNDSVPVILTANVSTQNVLNTENNLIEVAMDNIATASVVAADAETTAATAVTDTANALQEEPAEQLQITLIQEHVNNPEVSIVS